MAQIGSANAQLAQLNPTVAPLEARWAERVVVLANFKPFEQIRAFRRSELPNLSSLAKL